MMQNFIGKREKWTNTGSDEQYVADSFYTVQQIIPDVCTKFQNPRSRNPSQKKVDSITEKAKTKNPLYTSYARV